MNPITLWLARSPSILSLTLHLFDLIAITVTLHLRSKTLTLHLSDLNPRLTLHRRSHPHPHPSSPISPSTLASRSISDLHRHPPHQQQQLLRDPSQALAYASSRDMGTFSQLFLFLNLHLGLCVCLFMLLLILLWGYWKYPKFFVIGLGLVIFDGLGWGKRLGIWSENARNVFFFLEWKLRVDLVINHVVVVGDWFKKERII